MSIQTLYSTNFMTVGRDRKNLNINVPGHILVFFKMDGCGGCNQFTPIFEQLAVQDRRIRYAVANLTRDREIIAKSRESNTPIQNVPDFIFYFNGKPIAKPKKQDFSFEGLRSFITKALNACGGQQQQFVAQPNAPRPQQQGMYGAQRPVYQQPEAPSRGIKQNPRPGPYQTLGSGLEEEEDDKLQIPKSIIPKSAPWLSMYRELGIEEE